MNNSTILQKIKSLPTPFYYYDMELLENTIDTAKREADKYGFHLHYAVKANFNEPVLKMLAQKGFGADCVSGREVQKSVKAGFNANAVVFAGVGKSDVEIDAALDLDIFCFN